MVLILLPVSPGILCASLAPTWDGILCVCAFVWISLPLWLLVLPGFMAGVTLQVCQGNPGIESFPEALGLSTVFLLWGKRSVELGFPIFLVVISGLPLIDRLVPGACCCWRLLTVSPSSPRHWISSRYPQHSQSVLYLHMQLFSGSGCALVRESCCSSAVLPTVSSSQTQFVLGGCRIHSLHCVVSITYISAITGRLKLSHLMPFYKLAHPKGP